MIRYISSKDYCILFTLFLYTNTNLIIAEETTPSSAGVTNYVGTTGSYYDSTMSGSTDYYVYGTSPTVQTELTEEDKKLANCSITPSLVNYCKNKVDAKYFDFFKEDSSVIGMLASVIKPRIVFELQNHCKPGQWCLPESFQKEIADEIEIFYDQGGLNLCSNDFWKCLEGIGFRRRLCNESELFFLMSTVGALCDMQTIEGGITQECFTRTVEAITVLYSDLSNKNESVSMSDHCTAYSSEMINTYGCAMKSCSIQQRVFLKDFGPWTKLSSNAMAIADECHLKLNCRSGFTLSQPSQVQNPPATNTPQPTSGTGNVTANGNGTDTVGILHDNAEVDKEITAMMEEAKVIEEVIETVLEEMSTTLQPPTNKEESNDYKDIFKEEGIDKQHYDEIADTTFMYGMVIVTVVVITSLTIVGVLAFKRFNRVRKNYKMGYSQMSEEECRMLKNEYN